MKSTKMNTLYHMTREDDFSPFFLTADRLPLCLTISKNDDISHKVCFQLKNYLNMLF